MRIDPHVHFRDFEEAYKETIKGGAKKAAAQGINAVFDMPNTKPPIIWQEDVEKRIELALSSKPVVKYYFFVGLTKEKDQIKQAVEIAKNNPWVVGLKFYAGSTTGDLAILKESEQQMVWRTIAEEKYPGVVALHCEKESEILGDLFKPEEPWTHCYARLPKAEIESVRDQLRLAYFAEFKGTVHICHVSCPLSVDIIELFRPIMNVTCGVTPHHLLLTIDDAKKGGMALKMNPPLREKELVDGLWKHFRDGKINWIEADYAPHTTKDKTEKYASGFSDYTKYGELLFEMGNRGFPQKMIDAMTYSNIKKVFRKVRV